MASSTDVELTQLLNAAQGGDADASRRAWALIYDEVRSLAAAAAAQESHQYEPTLLFNEAYMRVRRSESWENRRHFFAAVRIAINRFLIDESRRRKARPDMRRAGRVELTFVEGELAQYDIAASDVGVELFKALEELENADVEQAEVVRLRYIEGCTIQETADRLGMSPGTVKNRWKAACAWLRKRLSQAGVGDDAVE